MATLDATVGGSSSNSYVTVAEADDYFTSRLNSSAWDTASKDAALITAAYDLDDAFDWVGDRASDTQFMEWPRLYVDDVDSTEIPWDVKRAQMELALAYVEGGVSSTQTNSVDEVKLGPLGVKFVEQGTYDRKIPSPIVTIVGILGRYIETSPNSVRMVELTR